MKYDLKENERWVVGQESRYYVDTHGRIYTILRRNTPKEMKYFYRPDSKTHQIVNLISDDGVVEQKSRRRVVAEAFIPNPDNHKYVIFRDGDNKNHEVSNLKWSSSVRYKPEEIKTE